MAKRAASSVRVTPPRQRIRVDVTAARCSDVLRARLATALRESGRYVVRRNVHVPLTSEAKQHVRKAKGTYLGTSLPCSEHVVGYSILDLLVIDRLNSWAGGYAVCWGRSHSARASRRIARDLRAIELVLRAHLARSAGERVDTVTVGIIDGAANEADSDDVTIALDEIEDHFDLDLTSQPDRVFR